jgi:hypothetical protein
VFSLGLGSGRGGGGGKTWVLWREGISGCAVAVVWWEWDFDIVRKYSRSFCDG